MKALVLGANGQLGRLICEVLESRELHFEKHQRSIGDLTSESFVRDYISAVKPSVIFNCAAWTDVEKAEDYAERAFAVNRDSVGYISSAAKRSNSILAHVSTDYVFPGNLSVPWKITDEKKPLSVYGKSKSEGEDIALLNYAENTYIFRTAWLYSQYGRNFVKRIILSANSGNIDISVVADQVGQPTSAKDLAQRIIDTVMERSAPGIYHATNSGKASWYEFAQEILELLGNSENKLNRINSDDYIQKANRPRYSVLDHSGWSSTSLPPMRDWRSALKDDFLKIVEEVQKEQSL